MVMRAGAEVEIRRNCNTYIFIAFCSAQDIGRPDPSVAVHPTASPSFITFYNHSLTTIGASNLSRLDVGSHLSRRGKCVGIRPRHVEATCRSHTVPGTQGQKASKTSSNCEADVVQRSVRDLVKCPMYRHCGEVDTLHTGPAELTSLNVVNARPLLFQFKATIAAKSRASS